MLPVDAIRASTTARGPGHVLVYAVVAESNIAKEGCGKWMEPNPRDRLPMMGVVTGLETKAWSLWTYVRYYNT